MPDTTPSGSSPWPSSSSSPAPAPEGPPLPPESRWRIGSALAALALALFGTLVLLVIAELAYLAAGEDHPSRTDSFEFVGIAAQSAAFVAAALLLSGRAGPRAFGFRHFKPSAFGWALLAIVAYFVVSAIYTLLVNPPEDDLAEQLGADESTVLAVVTGVFVIGVAPPVEEMFFRGFLYQAFRNRIGVAGGAVTSGLLFGAIHLKPEFLVPLAVLGTALALLFQKTNSLWPCIFVHALNNALAFSVSV
jgi:hypothetical protein